jgi:hypothetical protein
MTYREEQEFREEMAARSVTIIRALVEAGRAAALGTDALGAVDHEEAVRQLRLAADTTAYASARLKEWTCRECGTGGLAGDEVTHVGGVGFVCHSCYGGRYAISGR